MYTQIHTVFLAVYCLTSLSAADKSARSDLVAATAELRSMKASVEEQVGRIKAVRDSDAGGSSYSTARTAYERTATNFNTVMEAIAVIGQHPGKESRRLAYDALVHLGTSTSEVTDILCGGTEQEMGPRATSKRARSAACPAISIAPFVHLLNAALELGNNDQAVKALPDIIKDLLWSPWDKVPFYDKSLQRRND